ncbi:hypothetical protein Vafri_1911 [Volvox africanus]|nr:hypothetical protein Vafri_1911 [Volvox africanus]
MVLPKLLSSTPGHGQIQAKIYEGRGVCFLCVHASRITAQRAAKADACMVSKTHFAFEPAALLAVPASPPVSPPSPSSAAAEGSSDTLLLASILDTAAGEVGRLLHVCSGRGLQLLCNLYVRPTPAHQAHSSLHLSLSLSHTHTHETSFI